MEIVYLLVPIALLLIGLVIALLIWAIQSGQFDDLEGPAHRILMDDDVAPPPEPRQTIGIAGNRNNRQG